jgi:hypothetical protein
MGIRIRLRRFLRCGLVAATRFAISRTLGDAAAELFLSFYRFIGQLRNSRKNPADRRN